MTDASWYNPAVPPNPGLVRFRPLMPLAVAAIAFALYGWRDYTGQAPPPGGLAVALLLAGSVLLLLPYTLLIELLLRSAAQTCEVQVEDVRASDASTVHSLVKNAAHALLWQARRDREISAETLSLINEVLIVAEEARQIVLGGGVRPGSVDLLWQSVSTIVPRELRDTVELKPGQRRGAHGPDRLRGGQARAAGPDHQRVEGGRAAHPGRRAGRTRVQRLGQRAGGRRRARPARRSPGRSAVEPARPGEPPAALRRHAGACRRDGRRHARMRPLAVLSLGAEIEARNEEVSHLRGTAAAATLVPAGRLPSGKGAIMRILVIDDYVEAELAIAHVLQGTPHVVAGVRDPRQLPRVLAKAEPFDLALVDMIFVDCPMTGLGALRLLAELSPGTRRWCAAPTTRTTASCTCWPRSPSSPRWPSPRGATGRTRSSRCSMRSDAACRSRRAPTGTGTDGPPPAPLDELLRKKTDLAIWQELTRFDKRTDIARAAFVSASTVDHFIKEMGPVVEKLQARFGRGGAAAAGGREHAHNAPLIRLAHFARLHKDFFRDPDLDSLLAERWKHGPRRTAERGLGGRAQGPRARPPSRARARMTGRLPARARCRAPPRPMGGGGRVAGRDPGGFRRDRGGARAPAVPHPPRVRRAQPR